MGCFFACFGSSKDEKRRQQKYKVQSRCQSPLRTQISRSPVKEDNTKPVNLVQEIRRSPVEEDNKKPVNLVQEIRDEKPDEQLICAVRKKVTFDSTVKVYDRVSIDSARESKDINSTEEFPFISKDEPPKQQCKRYQNCRESDDDGDEGFDYYDSIDDIEDKNVNAKLGKTKPSTPNYRYQNCRDSDDEDGISDYDDDLNDDEDDDDEQEFGDAKQDTVGDNFDSVLTPIENLTQWRAAKTKPLKPLKENSTFDDKPKLKEPNQEVSVDASLSNWLVSSESNSVNKKGTFSVQSSPSICGGSVSREDRPILGVLTVEDLRQCSVTSSPRKSPSPSPEEMPIIGSVGAYWKQSGLANSPRRSPSKSPDDMAIIGSVGSYWSDSVSTKSASSFKGIPNTTSKYREDKKVNWHSTPFETRLERALKNNKTADEDYVS